MENNKKPDNLESFFQRVLKDYEEEPDVSFWNNIAPNIPAKPALPTKTGYKGWMLFVAFLAGILLSSAGFYWKSNASFIQKLQADLTQKKVKINQLEQELIRLKQSDEVVVAPPNQNESIAKKEEITLRNTPENQVHSIVANTSDLDNPTDKDLLIKLEIARNKGVVATTDQSTSSLLQPSYSKSSVFVGKDFSHQFKVPIKNSQLLFDNQLITNSFFVNVKPLENQERKVKVAKEEDTKALNFLTLNKPTFIPLQEKTRAIDQRQISKLLKSLKKKANFGLGNDGLTSFVTVSTNPLSGLKYNLKGYQPQSSSIVESAGITTSWNWSAYGGFETKSKWSVQMGIDFNKLTIFKESVSNIRFKASESQRINEGYVYSFNRRSEGALGSVSVSATIFNQIKNDNQNIENGDLFKLSVTTEQPVQIIRVPIMGGYRFDLSSRVYVMPKIGFSSVWKTKDRTQLRSVDTFDDRLSVQKSGIFLTSKLTTESLEANFRTEFGFRWRPRWYLVAEPRFKYAGKALFQYKDLELRDSPFQLMLGIRFNVD